eukprot:7141291-Karenia_brevis.AAC.1
MSTPLGPEQEQTWFWGSGREAVSTLGFFLTYLDHNNDTVHHKVYCHYITNIVDHTTLFAKAALKHVLERFKGPEFHTLHLWSDCAPHFRSYPFVWAGVEICKEYAFNVVTINYDCQHHGKSRNDGQFGLQRGWVEAYTVVHVIDPLSAMA